MEEITNILIKSFDLGLPNDEELYPMLSSTAAKSRMSLICAQSYPCNLAFECVKKLSDTCVKSIGKVIQQ